MLEGTADEGSSDKLDQSDSNYSIATAPPLSRPTSGDSADLYDLSQGKSKQFKKNSIGFQILAAEEYENKVKQNENETTEIALSTSALSNPRNEDLISVETFCTNKDEIADEIPIQELSTNPFGGAEDVIINEKPSLISNTNPFGGEEDVIINEKKSLISNTNPFGDENNDLVNENSPPEVSTNPFDGDEDETIILEKTEFVTEVTENETLTKEKSLSEQSVTESCSASSTKDRQPSPPTRPSSSVLSVSQLKKSSKVSPYEAPTGSSFDNECSVPVNNYFGAFSPSPDFSEDRRADHPIFTFEDGPTSKAVKFLKQVMMGVVIMTMVGVIVMYLGSFGKSFMR